MCRRSRSPTKAACGWASTWTKTTYEWAPVSTKTTCGWAPGSTKPIRGWRWTPTKTPGIKRDYFPSGHAMRGAGRAAASRLQGVRLAPGGLLCHTRSLRLLQGPTKTFV
ncbi:hypothetical protein B0H14DRAFT_2579345 [Mycena olivaceomarginata]|nr:hypothetical protein B0H14DRAFT_2579345 [Mycena olivaceomarginata]